MDHSNQLVLAFLISVNKITHFKSKPRHCSVAVGFSIIFSRAFLFSDWTAVLYVFQLSTQSCSHRPSFRRSVGVGNRLSAVRPPQSLGPMVWHRSLRIPRCIPVSKPTFRLLAGPGNRSCSSWLGVYLKQKE